MSVDYRIVLDGETAELREPLNGEGGTYALGGSTEAELNVTYNYGKVFAEVYRSAGRDNPGMVEMLDGRPVSETISTLAWLAAELPDEPGEDYWAPTPGNAGHAVAILLRMARELPEGTWQASG